MHRRLGKLESAMRAGLFSRSPRGYALTEAGQDLYAHALAMEEQASAAFRKVAARDEQPVGTVRLATVDDLAVQVLPPIIASFREKHPNVTVVVDVRQSFVDLAKQEADVALRFGIRPTEGDVVVRRVVFADIGLYATRTYLKRHGRPKTPDDLYEHALVRAGEEHARLPMERILDRYGNPAKTAFRSGSFFARMAAVKAGIGIGFVPFFMAAGDKQLERLHLPFPEQPRGADLLLIIHVDMRKNARVRAFVEHVHTALVSQRDTFERGE